ncbi:hypothetical protein SNE40_010017 [Patella caerulea]|uniref:Uncharacterized protein n=1 Tax=Patella caerulea TaxID=87958 RepID=A0AAN8JUF8_PATCE
MEKNTNSENTHIIQAADDDKVQQVGVSNDGEIPYVPPLEINQPKTSAHMPFVYFVVAENKMPVQVSLLDGTSQACNHAIRVRKQFINDKKKQAKRCQEVRKIIKEQNSMLGLCLGPVKDSEGNTATALTNDLHPLCNSSNNGKSTSEKSDYSKKHTRFYGLSDYEQEFDSDPSVIESVKKCNSIINLELSVSEKKDKAIRIPSAQLPTERDHSKRVQFSEYSSDGTHPKRCISKSSATSSRFPSRLSMYSTRSEPRYPSPDKPDPSNGPMTSSRPQLGNKSEMALPKIDLMDDMYDEVIIKAIDTFMTSRKISAKRRPQMERRLISRLAMARKYQMEVDAKIRNNSATTCHSRASVHPDRASLEKGDEQPSKSIPLKPTAFSMVSPGMQITR